MVAVTNVNPLFEQSRQTLVTPSESRAALAIRYTFVSPEYFPLLHIPVVRGRAFRPDEAASEAPVGIISAATARVMWPDADPIGKTVRIEHATTDATRTLAEIHERHHHRGGEGCRQRVRVRWAGPSPSVSTNQCVGDARRCDPRSRQNRRALPSPGPAGAARASASRPLRLRGLATHRGAGTADVPTPNRLMDWRRAGGIAMALSVSGLYGVLTYLLSQRTREIGIRMALGATSSRVLGLVMGQCARLTAAGAGAGVVLAFIVLKAFSSVVHMRNVTLLDATAFGAAVALVGAGAALAAYVPGRRATRINPSEALRADT